MYDHLSSALRRVPERKNEKMVNRKLSKEQFKKNFQNLKIYEFLDRNSYRYLAKLITTVKNNKLQATRKIKPDNYRYQ